jgi:two-component system, chemotaxis family, protein-glutamate methylesterase/glutaminase
MVPGRVLIAAPDRHLIVYDGRVTLSTGPRENGHRPAVDVLFRSAARVLGPRIIGVVLSGALDDGTAGLVAIRARGGVGVVQDPEEALHSSMPRCAIDGAAPEYVVSATAIPDLLCRLTADPLDDEPWPDPSHLMNVETAMADLNVEALHENGPPGEPAGLSCPDCNGSLFKIEEGGLVRFRCRVGHAWSSESLIAQQSTALESALWMALRSLEEKAALTHEMGRRAVEKGHRLSAASFEQQTREAHHAALLVRDLLARAAAGTVDLGLARR